MQPDNINAIGMILMLLATTGVIACFGRKPQNRISWEWRVICALPIGVITYLYLAVNFAYKCEVSSSTHSRGILTAYCIVLLIIFTPRKLFATIFCIIVFWSGYKLCSQFHFLVNKSGKYAYINSENGMMFNYACPDRWSGGVNAKKQWHSSFTGIYKVE